MRNRTIETPELYFELALIAARPEPFSAYTAEDLWTDAHTSERMLAFHLDPDIDVSSRRAAFIDESAAWIAGHFGLSKGKRVLDLGCGPGLYASRLAACGAAVTGVDFSPTSIAYARKQARAARQEITYCLADYLEFEPEGEFDLVIMIMCDFCALSPVQRSVVLRNIVNALSVRGRLVFDVYSRQAFDQKREEVTFAENLLDGFWSPAPYYGFCVSFKYEAELVSLDKYVILEKRRRREVYNWLQYFSVDALERELLGHGLRVESVLADVAGHPFDIAGSEFAVVAVKA